MIPKEDVITTIHKDFNDEVENDKINSHQFSMRAKYMATALRLNTRTFSMMLALSVFGLIISYLILSNYLISQGFVLEEARQKVAELSKQNHDLELTAMNLESYDNINQRIAQLDMVKVQDVEYITVKPEGVAMR